MEYGWREEKAEAPGFAAGGVIVSAFPSAGLATTVAAHYIVRSLQLPRIGRFESPDQAPIAVVQGGVVHPTVRVYGRPDLGLVLSEFPPTPAQSNSLARTILDNAERRAARMVLGLEGVVPHPTGEDDDAAPEPPASPGAAAAPDAPEQVWVAYSRRDAALEKAFAATKARPLEDGVIGGVSGSLLVQGIGRSVPVAVLLVSARVAEGLPDHRAGAALIEALDRLLPELRIDTGPLRTQAEEIEKALRAAIRSSPRASTPEGGPAPPAEEMYR